MFYYFVPLAYDRIGQKTGGGSMSRCEALLLKAYRTSLRADNCWFGSLAGYSKESPARSTFEILEPLCDQMKKFTMALIGKHGLPEYPFFTDPQAWGTYEEVRYVLQKIKNEQRYNHEQHNNIFFSTNLGHSPRVYLCLWFLKRELGMNREKFKFHVILANHSFSMKEYLQETAKFFVYLHKFIFRKF